MRGGGLADGGSDTLNFWHGWSEAGRLEALELKRHKCSFMGQIREPEEVLEERSAKRKGRA
jgi:hypothetical protein